METRKILWKYVGWNLWLLQVHIKPNLCHKLFIEISNFDIFASFTVTSYKVRWKPFASLQDTEDLLSGSNKAEEATVEISSFSESDLVHFSFPIQQVQVGISYKVNIFAVANSGGLSQESKELHEKFTIKSESEIEVYVEAQSQEKSWN